MQKMRLVIFRLAKAVDLISLDKTIDVFLLGELENDVVLEVKENDSLLLFDYSGDSSGSGEGSGEGSGGHEETTRVETTTAKQDSGKV